jgi:hypothetical protein
MVARDLLNRLRDYPFRPFRIHMTDRRTVDITHPFLISVGATSAILPAELGEDEDGDVVATRWQTVALLHMVRFTDLNGHSRPSRRRRGR